MVMVPPQQDLSAGKRRDILHVRLAFSQILPKAVVPGQNQRVIGLQHGLTVFSECFFMITTDTVLHLKLRL